MLETAWGFESWPTCGHVGTGTTPMRVIRAGAIVLECEKNALI